MPALLYILVSMLVLYSDSSVLLWAHLAVSLVLLACQLYQHFTKVGP